MTKLRWIALAAGLALCRGAPAQAPPPRVLPVVKAEKRVAGILESPAAGTRSGVGTAAGIWAVRIP